MAKVILTRAAERFINNKIYTIFSRWIDKVDDVKPGEWVEIYNWRGKLVGLGFYEGIGAVGLRVLKYLIDEEEFVEPEYLIEERIRGAIKRRKGIIDNWDAYRLINADGDAISGLIIDVYKDIAVIQSSSIGIDNYIDYIGQVIVREGIANKVFIKNDHRGRREAGLPIVRRWLIGSGDTHIKIFEDDVAFWIDIERGQKTGFFLDQRINRLLIREIIYGDVLDLFSYSGGFGIHSATKNANFVILVDESDYAVWEAKNNIYENNVINKVNIIRAKVEDFLNYLIRKDLRFDCIICDPPAYIQSREFYQRGLRSYELLYKNVFKIINDGGIIFASSCSYFLDKATFKSLLYNIAREVGVEIIFMGSEYGLSIDHVYRYQDRELNYLKAYLLRVERT